MASDKVKFSDVGAIAQAIKFQVRAGITWDELPPAAKEALDQIASVIARIVSGDNRHWDSIVTFAQAGKPDLPFQVAQSLTARQPGHLFDPAPELERNIQRMVKDIPNRNGES